MATATKTTKTVAAADPRLAAARKAHAAKKASDVSDVKATVVDTPTEPEAELVGVWSELTAALDKVQRTYGIISWKRYVCAMVLGSVVSFGTGYLLGMALDVLVTSAFMSGYMFLGWAMLIVGIILAIIAGAWLGKKAFHYVASEHIDEHAAVVAAAIKAPFRWVGSLFSSDKPAAA